MNIKLGVAVLLVLVPRAHAANPPPPGEVRDIPEAIHVDPILTERKIVHVLYNIWQNDPAFAKLISKDVGSQLCGPTALANALFFQREIAPKKRYPKIFSNLKNQSHNGVVRFLFGEADTGEETGTTLINLFEAWKSELNLSGYKVDVARRNTPAGITVTYARIGCLDIQRDDNLTDKVTQVCGGRQHCEFKAPTPAEISKLPGVHKTRTLCSQAMEITYHCGKQEDSKVAFVRGDAWAQPPAQLDCPTPEVPTLERLREEVDKGRVPVLLFGWYKEEGGKITRTGGHYVALSGYSLDHKDTFYITNPLIDYSKQKVPYSTIHLEWRDYRLDDSDLKTRQFAQPRMLYSGDVYKRRFGLLEDIVIVTPQ